MKNFVYLISSVIFGLGLSISGMIDPQKVKSFLSIGSTEWNPALIFVLGSAVPIYYIFFIFLRRRQKTFNGSRFGHPLPRPVDRNLIIGSAIFGVGWGIAGVCPGPALVNFAFFQNNILIFIVAMIAGFELHRRLA